MLKHHTRTACGDRLDDIMARRAWSQCNRTVQGTCDNGDPVAPAPELPCEDLVPVSSYCHYLGEQTGDPKFCTCAGLTTQFACGTNPYIQGWGTLDVNAHCQRTCGLCPDTRPPLFYQECPSEDHSDHGETDHSGHADQSDDSDHSGHEADEDHSGHDSTSGGTNDGDSAPTCAFLLAPLFALFACLMQ